MRNFIIFFEAKEGTSALVRLLDNFNQISIVHQVDDEGWEPFDAHGCGNMSIRSLKRSLDLVFKNAPTDFEKLNRIYNKTAKKPLEKFEKNGVLGFKMRFIPPVYNGPFLRWERLGEIATKNHHEAYQHMMFNLLRKHRVVIFLAVRQDVLRWGLSKYHGDGTGKHGHLQFKLAKGRITKDDIGKIDVDCKRLEFIISKCEQSHAEKRRFMESLQRAGIPVYPLCYEHFIADKQKFFGDMFQALDLNVSTNEIDRVVKKEEYFKKVHSDDISTFVTNHEEVMERFGDRFVSWL